MSAALFSFLLVLFSPGAGSPAAEASRMRRQWGDLEKRALSYGRDPAVSSALRGGGIALDRAALFDAAARNLRGAPDGFFLMFFDPSGDLLAWGGRAPTFLPEGRSSGAVWSAESALFFKTWDISVPDETRPARLAAGWRRPRLIAGTNLNPTGGVSWQSGADAGRWGCLSAGLPTALESGARASQDRLVRGGIFAAGSIAWLALALILKTPGPRTRGALSAASAFWSLTGAWICLSPRHQIDPADYFRQPLPLIGFSLAMLSAAAYGRAGEPRARSLRLALALAAAAFAAGTFWPGPGLVVAAAAVLTLLLGGALRPPGGRRWIAAAALGAAGLLGPVVLCRESVEARRQTREARMEIARDESASAVADRIAARLPKAMRERGASFHGAADDSLFDLAFALWRDTGLSAAPISGVRLWHEGRIVSRISFGIPFDPVEEAQVGDERIPIVRRRLQLERTSELPAGQAPDEADVEVGEWPAWRPLPSPLFDYRSLLSIGGEGPRDLVSIAVFNRRGDPAAGAPARMPSAGAIPYRGGLVFAAPVVATRAEMFLASFAAGVAGAAVTAAAGFGLAAVLRPRRRWRLRLRPATFRGRVTALFTVLVLIPFVAATIFVREALSARLRQETVVHAQTALVAARTVLDDYLFSSGGAGGRRELIDDDLLSWMAKVVGHDLSIYADGRLFSSSRRDLFSAGLLSERLGGEAVAHILRTPGDSVVVNGRLRGRPFDEVQAALASLPGPASRAGPAVLSIALLPQQRETEQEVARLSGTVTAFTLAVFGLSLLLGARTAYRVTGPIGALVEATRTVAKGDIPEVPPPDDAELRGLVDAFNTMARTLADQRDDLARAQRLRAWAEMARIIAHEIKNPLTPIRLSAEHMRAVSRRRDPSLDRTIEECVSNILTQTETLRTIASEFSDYARLPQPHMTDVSVEALAQKVQSAFSGAPDVEWIVAVSDLRVLADEKLAARALTNLVGNSVEALRGSGGRIAIHAERRGTRVFLRVEDDGPGVAAADLPKLFEPYFSSKSGGSGLGLAIVRRIAGEHGGNARAWNLSPRGFAVEFDLEAAPGI